MIVRDPDLSEAVTGTDIPKAQPLLGSSYLQAGPVDANGTAGCGHGLVKIVWSRCYPLAETLIDAAEKLA